MRLIRATLLALLALRAGASASVVYVNVNAPGPTHDGKSWATAFTWFPVSGGDEVWVAAGVYGLSAQFQMVPHTGYYGGFTGTETSRDQRDPRRNVTVIDASRMVNAVLAPPTVGRDAVLDGFTLRNVYAPGTSPGGGVACYGSPTIRNAIIEGLDIQPPAAGIYCARGAAPLIEGNAIARNGGDGVYAAEGSAPVIRGNAIEANAGAGIAGYSATVTASGNLITGHPASGIDCQGCAVTLDGNTVHGNAGGGLRLLGCTGSATRNRVCGNAGRGGAIVSGGAITLANNLFADNGGIADSAGIYCGSGAPLIANNAIVGTWGPVGAGVYIVSEVSTPAAEPVLANNIIAFNRVGVLNGYYPTGSSAGAPALRANCVYGNGADFIGLPDPTGANRNLRADPRLALPDYGNFHLQPGSPCIDAGDMALAPPDGPDLDGQPRVQGAAVDIGADEWDGSVWSSTPAVFRAAPGGNDANDGTTWETAKRTAQAAINAASAVGGGQAWLAAGTYRETLTVPPYVRLLGATDGATTIDAGVAGPAIALAPGAARVVLEDLSVTNGRAVQGAGIRCGPGSSATVRRVAVTGCVAAATGPDISSRGGGIGVDNAALTLADSVLAGNSARIGGGVSALQSMLSISNCSLEWNEAVEENGGAGVGGGLSSVCGPVLVTDTRFSGNSAGHGAGARVDPCGADAGVQRCAFTNNAAASTGGGLLFSGAHFTSRVADCVFARNTAGESGGALNGGLGGPAIVNNTFAANASPKGGAVCLPFGALALSNNIIAFNSSGVSAGGIYGTPYPVGRFNDLFENGGKDFETDGAAFPGIGHIHADPLFADRAAGDYRLRPGSPCVDAGDDAAVAPGETDADGRPRRLGRRVDMGAYESAFTGGLGWPDAIRAIRLAAGLDAASPADVALLGGAPDLRLAAALVRSLAR